VDLCENSDEETPLWQAVFGDHVPVCELLVEHGADLKHVNGEQMQLLIQACSNGNLMAVKFLVARGADLAMTDNSEGNTPFLTACKWGHVEVVKYLAKASTVDVDAENTYCSNHNPLDLLKFLFELGAKIDTEKSQLIGVSNVEMMKFLVDEKGCDLTVFSEYGTSPLAHAAFNGNWSWSRR